MAEVEPQYASDYDDRITVAVKSVLVEIGQVLGSYQGKFTVIGGAVPWLLAAAERSRYAATNRLKQKDAYDIYYSIRSFPGGVDALVAATKPLLDFETARTGYLHISEKFRHLDDFGPTSVRRFVDRPDVLGERTADQWQQDAFGQVDAWLSASGLR